jgi:hypothetical protein
VSDWKLNTRPGRVLITAPSTVADRVATAKRVEGGGVEGNRITVPAIDPAHVMTLQAARELALRILATVREAECLERADAEELEQHRLHRKHKYPEWLHIGYSVLWRVEPEDIGLTQEEGRTIYETVRVVRFLENGDKVLIRDDVGELEVPFERLSSMTGRIT